MLHLFDADGSPAVGTTFHARSRTCRSGVTLSGLCSQVIYISVGGTDRTAVMQKGLGRIEQHTDGAAGSMTYRTRTRPTGLQEVIVRRGGAGGEIVFAGHATGIRQHAHRQGGRATYAVTCQDSHWLLNRYKRVTRRFVGVAANTAVGQILAGDTDGGTVPFRVGSIPHSLGNITMDFTRERVGTALDRIAKDRGAYWSLEVLDSGRYVSMFTDAPPDGNSLALSDSSNIRNFDYEEDHTQRRTSTEIEGGGPQTTAEVRATETIIPVNDTSWFAANAAIGGTVRIGVNLVTWTAVSATSGAGSLTGCSGIVDDIPSGTQLYVVGDATNGAQILDVIAALPGTTGIILHYEQDGRLSWVEADNRSVGDVAFFGSAMKSIEYDTWDRCTKPGKAVSVNITAPAVINQSFRIQRVVLTPRRRFDSTKWGFEYRAYAAPMRTKNLTDYLARSRAS